MHSVCGIRVTAGEVERLEGQWRSSAGGGCMGAVGPRHEERSGCEGQLRAEHWFEVERLEGQWRSSARGG